jgi:cell wall-associated NlpC family hydrolase
MEGRVLTLRNPIVRRCFAAPIACCLLVTILMVEPATAEEGMAAGSSAVITASAPLAVRAAPGWDAAVSYEIAGGTAITVWDVAQVAPDGSLWYPVDGGFVPVDAVSSVSTLKGDVALYQDATQDAATREWVDPAPAAAAAPEQVSEPAATEEWVEPAAAESAPDTQSTETLAAPSGAVDPATSEWTDPVPVDPAAAASVDPVTGKSLDPATVEAVAPAPVDAVPVDAAPSDAPAPVNTLGAGGPEPWGEPIATAYITGTRGDGAPCLTAPDWQSATLAVLGEGEAVPVRAETMGEWQPVDCAGAGGYVHASFIAWTQMAAREEGDDGGRRESEAGHGGGASDGNEIVDFAMRYEGHPYVYAGDGPKSFDCSGFTMFVIGKTLGIDITHDMFVQFDMGSQVGRNDLQPGDLVFFKNTFRRGMSHTGIYIGGGQFIHAENESTGVRISDLDSDYYSSRWYGAVRYS